MDRLKPQPIQLSGKGPFRIIGLFELRSIRPEPGKCLIVNGLTQDGVDVVLNLYGNAIEGLKKAQADPVRIAEIAPVIPITLQSSELCLLPPVVDFLGLVALRNDRRMIAFQGEKEQRIEIEVSLRTYDRLLIVAKS